MDQKFFNLYKALKTERKLKQSFANSNNRCAAVMSQAISLKIHRNIDST